MGFGAGISEQVSTKVRLQKHIAIEEVWRQEQRQKGRRVCLRGAEFIQFLSELSILPRSIWKIG